MMNKPWNFKIYHDDCYATIEVYGPSEEAVRKLVKLLCPFADKIECTNTPRPTINLRTIL